MSTLKSITLACCLLGALVLGTENSICFGQNGVVTGKNSGYTGHTLAPASRGMGSFNWKYGFSGANPRYAQDMGGYTEGNIVANGGVYVQPETADYSSGYAASACEPCNTGCYTGCDVGCGSCNVGCNTCEDCSIVPFLREVAEVAFSPVYWVASALSCGTYADCGCAAVPRSRYCDPCDQCGNWTGGCRSCGGAGCARCASGMNVQSEMQSGPYNAYPASGMSVQPTMSEPATPIVPKPGNMAPVKVEGVGPTSIVVPVEKSTRQAQANMRPAANVKSPAPRYVFVTQDGKVIPPEQVEGQSAKMAQVPQYKVARQNDIKGVNYDGYRNATGTIQSGPRPVSQPVFRQTVPAPITRKYSNGKF